MKRSKHQDPKTKETPGSKSQRTTVVYGSLETGGASVRSTGWILNEEAESRNKGLHPFDLEERTATFGERIIRLLKRIPRGLQSPENNRLVDQLVGAGTSIGANCCEATELIRIFASMHRK